MNSIAPDPLHSLEGEVALITGGGTGIGLAIAEAMAHAGARVIVAGRRPEPLRTAAAKLGPQVVPLGLDVTDTSALEERLAAAREQVGSITVLVNNAGIHLKRPATDTTVDQFTSVWETHVRGAFAMTRAVLPSMLDRKHGSVLFIASMTSLIGIPQVIAYSAAKSAYLGMMRSLATEVSPHGVRVNCIAPGWIASDMLDAALNADPQRRNKILQRTPMQRFGEPQDIGNAAAFLCSRAAAFITGVVLPVDGGASIGF